MKKIFGKNIDTILFDFDGIIVDSEKYFYQSCEKVLKNKLSIKMNESEYYRDWTMKGAGLKGELTKRSIDISEELFIEIEKERVREYESHCETGHIKFIPGMLNALTELSKYYKTAIASNTPPDMIETIFARADKKAPCPIIGKQRGLRGKPEPDIIIYACGYLKSSPVKSIIIEDSFKGLTAAKKIQITTAVIKTHYWESYPYKGKIDYIFDSYKDFLDFI